MIKLNIDCLGLIFNQLKKDRKSLHSCLLVNKEWCNVIVPILWKEHSWNLERESMKKLLNIILSFLLSNSKQILLLDNNINLPSTIPLITYKSFNYISYCKFPKSDIIDKIMKMILKENLNLINDYNKINLIEQEIYKLFVNNCKNIKELYWETSQSLSSFPGSISCFSQLYNLHIDINFVNSHSLYEMAQICNNLGELTIKGCIQEFPGLISLIDAQNKLKRISIRPNNDEKYKELGQALRGKGNTITELHLGSIIIIPPSILTSLVNLKYISIYNNFDDNEDDIEEFQQYLSISEFPDLRSLTINGLSCFKELSKLIEKTKGNISNVYIYTNNKVANGAGMLTKTIANNCPKIEKFFSYLKPEDFIHVKLLLIKCKYLKYIRFYSLDFIINDDNNNIGDELLDILIKFSPESLTDIRISGSWKYSIDALERFFESFKERTLSYFALEDGYHITESHRAIVNKYMKEGVIKRSDIGNFFLHTCGIKG
jgi:hypothetical protein